MFENRRIGWLNLTFVLGTGTAIWTAGLTRAKLMICIILTGTNTNTRGIIGQTGNNTSIKVISQVLLSIKGQLDANKRWVY